MTRAGSSNANLSARSLSSGTLLAVLRDVVRSAAASGFRRVFFLNGHGGNSFRAILCELQPQTRVFLCTVNWWNCVDPRPYFDEPGDHAGELETSVTMHLAPHLVRPLAEATDGHERRFRIAALREGWAWSLRAWTQTTDDTGVGDPAAATAEKGARFVGDVAHRLAGFFADLAAADPSDRYA